MNKKRQISLTDLFNRPSKKQRTEISENNDNYDSDKENCETTDSNKLNSSVQRELLPSTPKSYKYQSKWKQEFLMAQGETIHEMTCILCGQKFTQAKKNTATRHIARNHPEVSNMTKSKKDELIEKFEGTISQSKEQMDKFLGPQKLVMLAPLKCAYVIGQHKLPFSHCEAMIEFARAADPSSTVFEKMSSSRQTITRKMVDINQKVLQPELNQSLSVSPYWGVLFDESTDQSTKEQLATYVRFANLDTKHIETHFLSLAEIEGSPNATNIFSTIQNQFQKGNLPTEKLVSMTSDGASVMISSKNGVAAKMKEEYNDNLFIQHCSTHRLALVAKDAQKIIPDFVEKTIKNTLDHFRLSPVRNHKFELIYELNNDDGDYVKLTKYHKIRWLSLSDCVSRLVLLLSDLSQYFEQESNNMNLKVSDRNACMKLYEDLANPEFLLYLHFLNDVLPQLADINCLLQKSNQVITSTYSEMFKFMRVFLSPVLKDDFLPLDKLLSDTNIVDFELQEISDPPEFGDENFEDQWKECIEHGQLSEKSLKEIRKNTHAYILQVGQSFLKRFPEADFIMRECRFLYPDQRNNICDVSKVVDRFNHCSLVKKDVVRQYKLYRHDEKITNLYEVTCKKNIDTFFITLLTEPDYGYQEFAKLCVLLLTISPDTCELERGFSVMNYVKSEYRSQLTQENLNAAIAIALQRRTVNEFPFEKCLK